MTRIKAISTEHGAGKTKELFGSVNTKMDMISNLLETIIGFPSIEVIAKYDLVNS